MLPQLKPAMRSIPASVTPCALGSNAAAADVVPLLAPLLTDVRRAMQVYAEATFCALQMRRTNANLDRPLASTTAS